MHQTLTRDSYIDPCLPSMANQLQRPPKAQYRHSALSQHHHDLRESSPRHILQVHWRQRPTLDDILDPIRVMHQRHHSLDDGVPNPVRRIRRVKEDPAGTLPALATRRV